jgi:vitellogenic carboxypeptidase-like protein
MNAVHVIILLYALWTTTTLAFLVPRFLRPFFKSARLHSKPSRVPTIDEVGNPLFLTPLIDVGRIDEARNLALVQPPIENTVSYSGFLTVNRVTKAHLFFWFFLRTETEDTRAPLLLWLQGGPGCSSLFGVFCENGPFEATNDGLRKREYAWTNKYHMLYIDQPVGSGFSYPEDEDNGYIGTEVEVGEQLYEALMQFYTIFPKMRERDFYISVSLTLENTFQRLATKSIPLDEYGTLP